MGEPARIYRETLRTTAQGVREAHADSEIGGYVGRAPLNRMGPFMDDKREALRSAVSRVSFAVPMAVPKPSGQIADDEESRLRYR